MKKNLYLVLLLSMVLLFVTGCANNDDNLNTQNEDTVISTTASGSVVTTGQTVNYDADGNVITVIEGEAFFGQDGDYTSVAFSFTNNLDETITDNNTGLMWQQIPSDNHYSWNEATEYAENLELAEYSDWRLPTIEELFSISDFSTGWPYLDTTYFTFPSNTVTGPGSGEEGGPQGVSLSEDDISYADINEIIDTSSVSKDQGQFWSSNYYEVTEDGAISDVAFGVNHATGHIKAYPASVTGIMGKHVRAVRGDVYGTSEFVDNNDGTIIDETSSLMWTSADLGVAVTWEEALSLANDSEIAGYSDWRLPNVKELQSIVDYDGSYPAINTDYFSCTELEDNENYYFWTSTSAYFSSADPVHDDAWYVAFGFAVDNEGNDLHGAGAVRFSDKTYFDSTTGEGGDNSLNSVRLVRNISDNN